MSGHSKWSTIKRKKGAADAKRGQLFTKLIREITVAARTGGGDASGNPRLRSALATARANSLPGDNIQKAIKRGTGELEGVHYEEATYEGYGPAGVAMLVQSLTDNKTRTVADLRNIFSKKGGNLGESGCVGWMFEKKGLITIDKKQISEEQLMEKALEAGADDVQDGDDTWEVYTTAADFDRVKETLEKQNLKPVQAEIAMIPKNTVKVGEVDAQKILHLMEALEDNDDVQKVFANFDIPEEILAKLAN